MINLLPPQQKEELRNYKVKRIAIALAFAGTVFLLSFVLVLLTLSIHLQGEVDYQSSVLEAKRGKSRTDKIESIQDEFRVYNKRIDKIQSFYKQQDYPSEFLKELESTLPSSVYLTSLSYEKVSEGDYKARVSFSGYCPDRNTLFELKNRMDEKERWENLKLPPSNWVEPADINFNVSFEIKSETKK